MNDQILNMVDQHRENSFFTHAEFNDETRAPAEQKLGLRLPEQYVEHLKTFGHGGVSGFDILGVGCKGSLIFVEETLLYRKYGLPKNLVVIENQGEWPICIDSVIGKSFPGARGKTCSPSTIASMITLSKNATKQ